MRKPLGAMTSLYSSHDVNVQNSDAKRKLDTGEDIKEKVDLVLLDSTTTLERVRTQIIQSMMYSPRRI